MSEGKPHKSSLVVFVHGFGSSKKCWEQLCGLLEGDPRVAPHVELKFVEYDTAMLAVGRKVPPLSELAGDLIPFIEGPEAAGYRDITLVGHSMGGLVIQTYIEAKLAVERGADLARLRQVILFATPNLGSLTLAAARHIVGFFLPNPQEEALRIFAPAVSSMHRKIGDEVVDAAERGPDSFPVPFVCFYGTDDFIVPEPSAGGRFDEVLELPGDHSSVIRPTRRDDPRYARFVEYLLEPASHRNFFEVEEWGVSVRVEPRDPAAPVNAVHGRKKRLVYTDNYARLTRSIRFSRRNRCKAQFELNYKTRGGGWVSYTTSHRNQMPPQDQRDYDDDGFNAIFKFTPRALKEAGKGETYRLDVDVYKGFEEGSRDLHFHLSDYPCIYHKIFFRLDLSAYLEAGFEVTDEPKLYLHEGPNTCDGQDNRELGEARAVEARDPRGVWEWEIDRAPDGGVIRDGIVDVKWDVAKKS